MKELKHLIYFENLLEDANNELVRKAEAEGDLAIGYTCFHAPEVLLNLGNCFSVRLRAPHTNSMELATYYMANNSCEFSRALLERAISEGDLVTDQGAEALTEVGLRLLRGTFMDWLIRGCSFDLEAAYTRGFAAFLRYARG